MSVLLGKYLVLAAVTVSGTAGLWLALPLTAQKNVSSPDFEREIAPVLKQNCAICHGGAMPQGELDLTSLQGALKGGKSGKVIVPGSAGRSLLLEKIVSGTMPPGKTKLDEKDVSLIRRWIDAGAGSQSAGAEAASGSAITTENDVLPIFQMRCVLCHGKRKQEGGLDLRTQAARLKGGKSGPALVPGKPEESLALKRILAWRNASS